MSVEVGMSKLGSPELKEYLCWCMSPCCLCPLLSSQETCWSDIQNTTAEKTMKLGTIKLAIFNLFQSLCMQLRANLKVSADDSHRQLDMVEPSQTPSPCPGSGAVMTLSCPKGGESPEKSLCPVDTFSLGLSLGHRDTRQTCLN